VLVLKYEQREVKLQALGLPDWKADPVFNGIVAVLDKYNSWESIKMIVADTTYVNTGRRNGIVSQLQHFFQNNREEQQFIGCQHHVLGQVLRVVMDEELTGNNATKHRISFYYGTCKELRTAQDEF